MKKVPEDYKFLVIGPQCWGKGITEKEAYEMAEKNAPKRPLKHYLVYLIDPSTRVTEMGDLAWDQNGLEPILIRQIQNGKDAAW